MQKPISLYKNEKNFGIVFGTILTFLGLYFIFFLDQLQITLFLLALIFFIIAFVIPMIFYYPNKIWMALGYYLGLITTPIFISLIYIFIVIPTGLILKIFGKDILDRKINNKEISNWKKRKISNTQLERQY